MPRLVMKTGKNAGKTYALEDKPMILGRGDTVQVRVHDTKASREHCRVFAQGDQWVVADLNSRNGITINGVKKTRHTLRDGDQIAIGETVVAFEGGGAAAAGSARGKSARMTPDTAAAKKKQAREKAFAQARSKGARPAAKAGGGGGSADEGLKVSDHVLQFSKVEHSFMGIDLGQLSGAGQFCLWAAMLGVLGGLGWLLVWAFGAE